MNQKEEYEDLHDAISANKSNNKHKNQNNDSEDSASSLSFDCLNDSVDDSYFSGFEIDDDNDDDIEKGGIITPSSGEIASNENHQAEIEEEHMVGYQLMACARLLVIFTMIGGGCVIGYFTYSFLATDKYQDLHDDSSDVYIVTGIAVGIVLIMMITFCIYDIAVRHHQRNLLKSAGKSKAIVNSLFPENVRSRLMESEAKASKAAAKSVDSHRQRKRQRRRERRQRNKQSRTNKKGKNKTDTEKSMASSFSSSPLSPKSDVSSAGGGRESSIALYQRKGKPIADFFPHCTVLFADIVGFTAWSSVRDPTQVFMLLETLYNCFDMIARRRQVFKVETIGDCYVAVTGLPEPQPDHALIMSKFARQCMLRMFKIVRDLEIQLGPDTGDLSMRFGLHSGPVTAGVMRGEKSRFQLFGDTVNTAARIESSGERAKIHLSEDTADLIIAAGKGHWVTAREEKVHAKGKGQLQTYWLDLSAGGNKSMDSGCSLSSLGGDFVADDNNEGKESETKLGESSASLRVGSLVAQFENRNKLNSLDERTKRQADYIVEVLIGILKKIAAKRGVSTVRLNSEATAVTSASSQEFDKLEEASSNLLAATTDSIPFKSQYGNKSDVSSSQVVIASGVVAQIKDFVTTIAALYGDHPYHSFEHSNHVMMSARKLFSRVVTEENNNNVGGRIVDMNKLNAKSSKVKKAKKTTSLHNTDGMEDVNFAITDDPMTEFALVFASLIHNVSHPGAPNSQLVMEGSDLAQNFGGKNIAEKNAIQVAWKLLMKPAYKDFRRCIYSTQGELERFRCLVVNLVLASDIQDTQSSASQSKRWEQAFPSSSKKKSSSKDSSLQLQDLKATLVMEHLFMAATIAHRMQHWNVFTKWNREEFREMTDAYNDGRGNKEPARYWFQGELSFFDTFVEPLATRIKDCGVFGDASEEYSNYAKANRRDWQSKGREALLDYMEDVRHNMNGVGAGKRLSPSSGHSNATYSTVSASSNHGSVTFKPPSSNGSLSGKPRSSNLSPSISTPSRTGKLPIKFKLKSPVLE